MRPKKRNSAAKSSDSQQRKRVSRVSKNTLNKKKQQKQKKQQQTPKEEKDLKQRNDMDLPKKPATAFFYYMKDFRKIYQEQNPEVKGMTEIGKACGIKWKEMTYEEKAPYFDIATQKRAEYEKILTAYRKRKEAGAFDEPDKTNSI